MKVDIPVFAVVDGEKTIASFDGYDSLYVWAKKTGNVGITQHPNVVLLFGELPMKYDIREKQLYVLKYTKV